MRPITMIFLALAISLVACMQQPQDFSGSAGENVTTTPEPIAAGQASDQPMAAPASPSTDQQASQTAPSDQKSDGSIAMPSADQAGQTTVTDMSTKEQDAKAFSSLLMKKKTASFMVTWGLARAGQTTEMTQYVQADKMRSDVSLQGYMSSTYILDGKMYTCSNYGNGWNCAESATKPDPQMDVENQAAKGALTYPVRQAEGKTILGEMTQCFIVTMDNGDTETCYTSDGIPLYMSVSTTDGMMEYTAKNFSRTVDPNVFVLPETSSGY